MKKRIFIILSLLFAANLFFSCVADTDRDNPFDPYNITISAGIPSVPVNLAVGTVSASSIAFSWDGSAGVTGYRIYRSGDDVSYSQITTVSSSSTIDIGYTDTGLTPGTLYYYRVSAYNNAGESDKSDPVSVDTIPNTASLFFTGATTDSITISWNSVSGADGYRIYQSADGIYFTQVGGNITAGTTYTDTGLSAGTVYYYEITSYSSGGESARSTSVSAVTVTDAPAITSVGSASVNSLTVSWSVKAGAVGYRVYRSTDDTNFNQVSGNVTSGTDYTDTGLDAATTYYYRVSAYNGGGESARSDSESGVTLPNSTSLTLGTATTDSISISWDSVSGADGYRVYRSTDNISFNQVSGNITSVTSYTDTGLTAGTVYYYEVSPYNGGGEGARSGSISGITITSAPTVLKVESVSASELKVSWSSVTGADGYRVYRSADNSVFTQVGSDITAGLSLQDSGLSSSTIYYYRVTAYNSAGESSYNSPMSNMTSPDAPAGLKVESFTGTSISISWNSVTGATGYKVYASTDDVTFTQTGTDITSGTKYTVTEIIVAGVPSSLVAGTRYYFRVSSFNSGGESSQSGSINAVPLGSPTDVTAAVMGNNGEITIRWTDVTGAEGYCIYWSTTTGVTETNGTKITGVSNPFIHTGLADGTTYYYIVTAVNDGTESAASDEVSAEAWTLTWTERTGSGSRDWISLASSSDLAILAGAVSGEYIYMSSNGGADWGVRSGSGSRAWSSITSSSDGTDLAASVSTGYIYTSSNLGINWVSQTLSPQSHMVVSSDDGVTLGAIQLGGYIYMSTDSGVNWTQETTVGSKTWRSISISDSGTCLAACAGGAGGYIYTSTDSGSNWTARTDTGITANWSAITISGDGTKIAAFSTDGSVGTSADGGETWSFSTLIDGTGYRAASSLTGRYLAAAVIGGYIYTSIDGGVTWVQQTAAGLRDWSSIVMSSDGTKIAASVMGGYVYTAE